MATSVFTCPECSRSLKTTRPLSATSRFRCPSCGSRFAAGIPAEAVAAPEEPGDDAPPGDYRISLTRWELRARPHYGAVAWPMVGFLFLYVAICFGLALLSLVVIGIPLLFIAMATLPAGPTIVCLAELKGESWTFNTFFGAFKRLGTWIALELLAGLVILLGVVASFLLAAPFALLGSALGDSAKPILAPFSAVAMLAGLTLTIYVWFRAGIFARQLVADRGFGAVQALKGSWELTRGHFWGLFGTLLLILLLVYVSAMCTFGIGAFIAMPRALLVLNAGYLEIIEARPLPPAGEFSH